MSDFTHRITEWVKDNPLGTKILTQQTRIEQLEQELAAEKALADRFGLAMHVSNSELQTALLAWRKARGL